MKILSSLVFMFCSIMCFAQTNYNSFYYGNVTNIEWRKDGTFTYKTHTPKGSKTYIVNPKSKQKTEIKAETKGSKITKPLYKQRSTSNVSLKIKDNNVYLVKGKDEVQLTFDGTTMFRYIPRFTYSSDSMFVVVIKERLTKEREITFVESTPSNQVQPLVHTRKYVKPGDDLVINIPMVINLSTQKLLDVDFSNYLEQFDMRNIRWNKDNRRYTFEYNKRGHSTYQIIEVNTEDASTRVVIDESLPTFIHYHKLFRYHLDDRDEILWISERDGYRHLYKFDSSNNSKIKQQLTKGEWVVRNVLYVDTLKDVIYFTASGRNKDENPYYTHLYRIDFDGKNLRELTKEEGNHTITMSCDNNYFVDSYSTPEKEPITTLRRTFDGEVLMNLEKGDASKAEEKGWIRPEVFSAKGRDNLTDIWGNIYFPKNYDADKKYPVVEYIYAGPHDSHVVNNFHIDTYYRARLTERGYIVVQMDGMGTSNRSKAFHDVCWRNLKDAGFPDRIKWIKAAAEKHPSMDVNRVGIYGVSAGGQNSTGALLFHGDFYKAAASSCGCHDNRMDKIWWNEQWMGYPIGKHYSESSNVDNAHLLKGKLMLIVGEMDTNVDPASTMQVVDKLVKAEKYFELLVLPGQGHTLGGQYGMDRVIDFFDRNL